MNDLVKGLVQFHLPCAYKQQDRIKHKWPSIYIFIFTILFLYTYLLKVNEFLGQVQVTEGPL
jgi:hypothetical protein